MTNTILNHSLDAPRNTTSDLHLEPKLKLDSFHHKSLFSSFSSISIASTSSRTCGCEIFFFSLSHQISVIAMPMYSARAVFRISFSP